MNSVSNDNSDKVRESAVRQLEPYLADPNDRHAFFDAMSFTFLLDNCIISKNYRISDAWMSPLKFTPLGESVISGVMQKRARLKINDVRLGTALAFACGDGVLLSPETNVEALRRQFSAELLRRNIMLPWIYGRELHDEAASRYPEKTSFNNTETIHLLSGLPTGVFQAGWSATGPYGCFRSREYRQMLPAWTVPGYYCDDQTCSDIHELRLRTGDSSVSRARSEISKYLSDNHTSPFTTGDRLVREAIVQEIQPLYRNNPESLIDTIADGLSLDEFRKLVDLLLRQEFAKEGTRQDLQRNLGGVIANPSDFVQALEPANLLQILLFFTDAQIENAIDHAVLNRKIELATYELRTSRISRFSAGAARAEIGPLGVRYAAPIETAVIGDRLLRLLHQIYFSGGDLGPRRSQVPFGEAGAGCRRGASEFCITGVNS